ncbi:hypothetical protein [Priestia megaterium]|uniref:hypothetical protein n=1 Tax=Priestia megaterium TaxID=1404 RepID=UPI002E22B315|nr:hypothetical protein [Priestia megaterium]
MTPQLIGGEGEVLHGNQLIEESKQMKPAFTITKKNEPLIESLDQWFVFHFV